MFQVPSLAHWFWRAEQTVEETVFGSWHPGRIPDLHGKVRVDMPHVCTRMHICDAVPGSCDALREGLQVKQQRMFDEGVDQHICAGKARLCWARVNC